MPLYDLAAKKKKDIYNKTITWKIIENKTFNFESVVSYITNTK